MTQCECYAYKSEKGCVETFRDHVVGLINCVDERWEFRGLVKKLSKLYGFSEEIFRDLVTLSLMLHDIGKITRTFQEECRRAYCVTFTNHYVLSSKFAVTLGKKAGLLNQRLDNWFTEFLSGFKEPKSISDFYLVLVVLPVLLHHYAGISEKSLLKALEETRNADFEVDPVCGNCVNSLISDISIRSDELKGVKEALIELIKESKIELSTIPLDENHLSNYMPSPTKAIIEASTGLLNLCDGRVAYEHRRCD